MIQTVRTIIVALVAIGSQLFSGEPFPLPVPLGGESFFCYRVHRVTPDQIIFEGSPDGFTLFSVTTPSDPSTLFSFNDLVAFYAVAPQSSTISTVESLQLLNLSTFAPQRFTVSITTADATNNQVVPCTLLNFGQRVTWDGGLTTFGMPVLTPTMGRWVQSQEPMIVAGAIGTNGQRIPRRFVVVNVSRATPTVKPAAIRITPPKSS